MAKSFIVVFQEVLAGAKERPVRAYFSSPCATPLEAEVEALKWLSDNSQGPVKILSVDEFDIEDEDHRLKLFGGEYKIVTVPTKGETFSFAPNW